MRARINTSDTGARQHGTKRHILEAPPRVFRGTMTCW